MLGAGRPVVKGKPGRRRDFTCRMRVTSPASQPEGCRTVSLTVMEEGGGVTKNMN